MAKKTVGRGMMKSRMLPRKHPGHSQHMCELVAKREMAAVAKLSKNAKYICHICGRAASDAANLCEPLEI